MNDQYDISRIRAKQEARIARESWDYLNMNSKDYPEVIARRGQRHFSGRLLSVEEVRKEVSDSSNQSKRRRK